MDPLDDIRKRLEDQLNEFFNPYTSNARKQQIEILLESFSKQPGSWKQSLYFLSCPQSFSNEYLTMYCLTVIENCVKRRFVTMSEQEKTELQSTLYNFLVQHASAKASVKCPNFIRNKVIKVLSDVGKYSWPHDQPDFLNNVLKISTDYDMVLIGLLFLKTISDEWSACKDEISTDRKLELRTHLVKEMRKIFSLLQEILSAGAKMYSVPDASGNSNNPQLTAGLKEVLILALSTSGHLMSWIPLDLSYTLTESEKSDVTNFVPFTVDFLRLLCQYTLVDISGTMSSNPEENLSISALHVLNELLYRKFVPTVLNNHIRLVINFGIDLISIMQQNLSSSTIDRGFLDKGVEFICLIANAYFFRYGVDKARTFTSILLPFTFSQRDPLFYYECLEIWKLILDHLISEVPFPNVGKSREELLEFFKPVMLDVADGIVNSTKKFEVDTLSEEFVEVEDDEDSDLHTLSKNIDVLIKIGELYPTEALSRVSSTWTTTCQFFESLQTKLCQDKSFVVIDNTTDVKHFSFVVQLIGRIAELFYGDYFKNEIPRGKALFHQLLNLMMISKNYYFVKSPEAIVQANCEIVYSLRTWTYWLGRYYSEVMVTDVSQASSDYFDELVEVICVEGLCFCLENRTLIDPRILLAHANFFSLVVHCVRTKKIFTLPWIQSLIQNIMTLKDCLEVELFRVLNKALSSMLLLPWTNLSTAEQDWDRRTSTYESYMKLIMAEIVNCTDPNRLVHWLKLLNDQLDTLQSELPFSKNLCWSVYKDIVPVMYKVAPIYISHSELSEEIFEFFLKIMETLRQQAGVPFFEETVRFFLNLFGTANIINDLMKESNASAVVVEKFMKILQCMIKDPNSSLKKFLPDCLSVTLDHIYPVLAQRSSPEVKLSFYTFIRDVLHYRWNYFFPGFLYVASPSNSPSSASEDDLEVTRRLKQIFETLGQSFLQTDLEIFRYNLNTLTLWNQKHQIYTRIYVDLKLFDGFMSVLIQVLANKSHDMLKDDITRNLYEMATVDYNRFWQVFIPQSLQKDFPLLTVEHRTILCAIFKPKSTESPGRASFDLLGFSGNLWKFIDDIRFFHFHIQSTQSAK